MHSQVFNSESIGFGLGFGSNDYNKDSDIVFMEKSYVDIPEFNKDHSDLKNGKHRKAFLKQAGFYVEYTFKLKKTSTKMIFPLFKLNLGVNYEDIVSGYFYKEDFKGKNGATDTLKTQSLSYYVGTTLYHAGFTTLLSTNYFGEKVFARLYGGLSFQYGMGHQEIHTTQKNNVSLAFETNTAGTYSIVGNAIKKEEIDHVYQNNNTLNNTRFTFPMGIELTGSNKKLMMFVEVKFGISTYSAKNIGSVSGNSSFVSFGARYALGKAQNENASN